MTAAVNNLHDLCDCRSHVDRPRYGVGYSYVTASIATRARSHIAHILHDDQLIETIPKLNSDSHGRLLEGVLHPSHKMVV